MNAAERDRPALDDSRATMTVAKVAAMLGLSTSRIHQMLDSDNDPLAGPPKPGRGRGRERLVFTDTIPAQARQQERGGRSGQPSDGGSLRSRVATLETRLAQLQAAVQARSDEPTPVSGQSAVADLRWAISRLNAASEALHQAAADEAGVRRLQREAIERLNQALELQDQASNRVRRADQIRSEVLGMFLIPNDPHGL